MRGVRQGSLLVQWILGVTSSICVAAVLGLARTVVHHEVALAVLRENCGKSRKVTAVTPPPTIWSAFGLVPVPQSPSKLSKGEP